MLCMGPDNFFDEHERKIFVSNKRVQELHYGVIIEHSESFNQRILETNW